MTVSHFGHHPKRVTAEIRDLASDFSKVDYSKTLNSPDSDEFVSMSAIWACLEKGEINVDHLHCGEEKGDYAKIEYFVEGIHIYVDVLLNLDPVSGEKWLTVLYAGEI